MNQPLEFRKGGLGTRFLIDIGGNWAWPEAWGVWSKSNQAKLILPIPQEKQSTGHPKYLNLNVRAFVSPQHPKQNIEVFVDNMPPQVISITNSETNAWLINLPPNLAGKKYLEIQFHFMNPASPKDVGGIPGDDRRLGLGLISVQFM